MENDSRLARMITALTESQAFQTLKAKWEELDPQSRYYIKVGSLISSGLIILLTISFASVRVAGLQREVNLKNELLSSLRTANDELRSLRDSNAALTSTSGASAMPWNNYIETTATSAGIDKALLTISPEKPVTTEKEATAPKIGETTVKEVLLDVTLKKVNIKQAVRLAYQLEAGSRPVKLRNLTIDTKNDRTGYMDAVLSLSAFSLVTK